MGKLAVVLLTEAFVILPIVFGSRFHGHNSYKEYYDTRVNGGRQKQSTTASYEMTKELYYNLNDIKSRIEDNKYTNKGSSGFSGGWQARNGDRNYARVTRCEQMKQTFCEDVPDYPTEFVNQMLFKNSSLLHYVSEDVIPIVPRVDTNEQLLCLSEERIVRPRSGINLNDEWLYILQSDELKFYQKIRIETCKEEDAKCRLIDGFAEGYLTMCKQKYIFRELTAISKDGDIVRDIFRFPASCCCHVQFKIDDDRVQIRSFSEDIFRPRVMQNLATRFLQTRDRRR